MSALIVYGSYVPGGKNHHVLSDLPGRWEKGAIVATLHGPDEVGTGEQDIIEAWMIRFDDCEAEVYMPEYKAQEQMLFNRWQTLDRHMGSGCGRDTRRWWPEGLEAGVMADGMSCANIYLPLKHFSYLQPTDVPMKPIGQETLDIWVGYIEPEAQEGYFEEHHHGDDHTPISGFVGDQGERWVDHDFMEVGFVRSPASVFELVQNHSWHEGYVDELVQKVTQQGIESLNTFVFLKAKEVTAPRSISKEGVALHYMGQFTVST